MLKNNSYTTDYDSQGNILLGPFRGCMILKLLFGKGNGEESYGDRKGCTMKMALFLFLFFFITLFSIRTSADEYSLKDLFHLALERSDIIKIAEEDVYISVFEKDKALADLLPTFSAFGSHIHYSEEKRQSSFLLQPDYTNEWGLQLEETLSLGGREFTTYNIAKEGIRKSEFDLHAVREGYLLDVASQYYAVLGFKKGKEISIANVERLTKHRDASRTRLEVGEATKTVLLRAEAELAGAQSDLIKAGNNLKLAKTRLAKSVGIRGVYDVREPQPGIDFRTPESLFSAIEIFTKDCQLPIIDCLKEISFSERAEIKSLTIQREIAEDGVTAAKSAYWPNLSIEGVYFRQENEPSSSFELNERIYGGVRLDFPFFEGGRKKADVSEAKGRLRQAEYSLSDLRAEVGVEVENSYLIVEREAALLKQVQAELAFAQENYESVTKQFQYGLADSIDAIDANTLLVTSERDLVNAEYIYQLAILRLKRVTGILLKEIINRQDEAERTEPAGQ
jgi:outer membrane protein